MMNTEFNFDRVMPRRHTGSLKWDSDGHEDIIPLWVADMDFPAPREVREAVMKASESGLWGYTIPTGEYYDAVVGWFRDRHGWDVVPEYIRCTTGVMPAVTAAIRAITSPGDGIVIMPPVYNCFFDVIPSTGRQIIKCPLVRKDIDRTTFTYGIDFAELDRCLSASSAKVLLMCNPHNPAGRVWSRAELEHVDVLCRKHGVKVISDEIHCELTAPGIDYVPFATINPDAVICCSPSKGFNIAGLQVANVICGSQQMSEAVDRELHATYNANISPMGAAALIAAYRYGASWLDALRAYINSNYKYLVEYLSDKFPIAKLEGTYLAWVDVTRTGLSGARIHDRLIDEAHVWVCPGDMYGDDRFIRINLACPRQILAEGLRRCSHSFQ